LQTQLAPCFKDKERLGFAAFQQVIRDRLSGVVRVSLGLASTFGDAYRFVQFAGEFIDRRATAAAALRE
jgi:hypothetical protein